MPLFSTTGRCSGRAALLLAAAISLLAASGCGGAGAESTGATSSTEGTGGVTVSGSGGATVSSDGEVFFPLHAEATYLVGNNRQLLEDEAGCIRFRITEGEPIDEGATPTVVWPYASSWSAERGEDGRVRILQRKVVRAVVGEEVRIGDGFLLTPMPLEEVEGVDDKTMRELLRRCPGEYYFVGGAVGPPYRVRGEPTRSEGY